MGKKNNNFPLMTGQPKKEIADYVECNSPVFVPRRYTSLAEALEHDSPFIIRSESSYEYEGAAGLLESYTITREILDRARNNPPTKEEVRKDFLHFGLSYSFIQYTLSDYLKGAVNQKGFEQALFKDHPRVAAEISFYSKLLNLAPGSFEKSISYSFWEYIEGTNGFIIADSAVAGRFHILTYGSHMIVDKNKVAGEFYIIREKNRTAVKSNQFPLISFYETIRNLPAFDRGHCPIIEFQISRENKIYFLQYHKTRDFKAAGFTLERSPASKEFEASFIRGATSNEGKIYETRLFHPSKQEVLESEKASFELYPPFRGSNKSFIEVSSRKRELLLLRQEGDTAFCPTHVLTSQLFNPDLSMVVDLKKLFTLEEINSLYAEDGGIPFTKLFVIADGKKGYIKRESDIYFK